MDKWKIKQIILREHVEQYQENVKDSGSANYVPKKLSKQEQEQLFKESQTKSE